MVKLPIPILYVNQTSQVAGGELSLLALMSNLDKEIWRPILLLPKEGLFSKLTYENGIKTYFLSSIPPGSSSVLQTYRSLLYNAIWIWIFIQKHKIQIVHSNNPRVSYHGGLGAKLANIPSIMHVRDIENLPFSQKIKNFFINYIVDVIVPVSNATKKEIINLNIGFREKCSVIHNGVDTQLGNFDDARIQILQEFGIADTDFLLASFGRLTSWKGYETTIKAVEKIIKTNNNVHLLIVGEPWKGDEQYYDDLKNLVDNLNLSEKITFTGFRSDVSKILTAIDICIHSPIKPDPLPRILLEASIIGKPVVASDIGGIGEIVIDGQTGKLFQRGNINFLAKAIMDYCNNQTLLKKHGVFAREHARANFSISSHVLKIEKIYKELLDI